MSFPFSKPRRPRIRYLRPCTREERLQKMWLAAWQDNRAELFWNEWNGFVESENVGIFSLWRLFVAFVPNGEQVLQTYESTGDVDSWLFNDLDAFPKVVESMVSKAMLHGYLSPDFKLSQAVPHEPMPLANMPIWGISDSDAPSETQLSQKRGMLLNIRLDELLLDVHHDFDALAKLLVAAENVGQYIGLNKERRIAKVFLSTPVGAKYHETDLRDPAEAVVRECANTVVYQENWPLQLICDSVSNVDMLAIGVACRWKASERGKAAARVAVS